MSSSFGYEGKMRVWRIQWQTTSHTVSTNKICCEQPEHRCAGGFSATYLPSFINIGHNFTKLEQNKGAGIYWTRVNIIYICHIF